MNLTNTLFMNQDLKYRDFSSRLIPNIDKDSIIGVRNPVVKKIVKDYLKENNGNDFLNDLPHKYQEENMAHTEIIKSKKKYR